jgi:hypothetical protein
MAKIIVLLIIVLMLVKATLYLGSDDNIFVKIKTFVTDIIEASTTEEIKYDNYKEETFESKHFYDTSDEADVGPCETP